MDIRGRPFDSEGGGGAGKGRDILFIFSVSSAGKLIFKNTKARIFIFIRNIFLEKQKKKKQTKQNKKGGRGRNVG